MKLRFILLLSLSWLSCNSQVNEKPLDTLKNQVQQYYKANKGNGKPSISKGSVENGTLENGRLIPFYGKNFQYFDATSYLSGRAFVNDKVETVVLNTYAALDSLIPGRNFCVMECSGKNGGKITYHNTHQNGLSVDFMMPKLKNGQPFYGLDTLGAAHYFLEFNRHGQYVNDTSILIDFDLIARHILLLDKHARTQGLKVSKVIIHTAFKEKLFATPNGKLLQKSGIYVVKALKPITNKFHDEHYHIDFK